MRGAGFASLRGAGRPTASGRGAGAFSAAAPTPPFDPLTLSPLAWYDASDLTTLWQDSARTTPVTAEADPVGAIDDKSGNGKHAVQATGAARFTYRAAAQNGKGVIEADGTDDVLSVNLGANAQPFTLFAACKYTADDAGNKTAIGGGGPALVVREGGVFYLYAGAVLGGGPASDALAHTFIVLCHGGSSVVRIDGAVAMSGAAGTDPLTVASLGAYASGSGHAPCRIFEAFYVAGDQTASAAAVHAHLKAKWGTT